SLDKSPARGAREPAPPRRINCTGQAVAILESVAVRYREPVAASTGEKPVASSSRTPTHGVVAIVAPRWSLLPVEDAPSFALIPRSTNYISVVFHGCGQPWG